MQSKFQILSAITVMTLSLLGCASTQPQQASCEQKDWYELGRSDGSQGLTTEKWTAHKQACAKEFRPEWETMYLNGRNSGLVDYCDTENGYELGRTGSSYFYVCPSTMEPQFLSGFRRGQKAHELEIEIRKLDAKIDSIAQQLVSVQSGYDRNVLSSEMEQLKRLRTKNDRQLDRISRSGSI